MNLSAWVSNEGNGETARVSDRLVAMGEELLALWQVVIGLREPAEDLVLPEIGAEAERLAAELLLRQKRSSQTESSGGEDRQAEDVQSVLVIGRAVGGSADRQDECNEVTDITRILRRGGMDGNADVAADGVVSRDVAASVEGSAARRRGGALADVGAVGVRRGMSTAEDLAVLGVNAVLSDNEEFVEPIVMRGYGDRFGVAVEEGVNGGGISSIGVIGSVGGRQGMLGSLSGGRSSVELSDDEIERICNRMAERLSESIEIYLQSASMRG